MDHISVRRENLLEIERGIFRLMCGSVSCRAVLDLAFCLPVYGSKMRGRSNICSPRELAAAQESFAKMVQVRGVRESGDHRVSQGWACVHHPMSGEGHLVEKPNYLGTIEGTVQHRKSHSRVIPCAYITHVLGMILTCASRLRSLMQGAKTCGVFMRQFPSLTSCLRG